MKAILINPIDRTISEVEYSGDYNQINTYIESDLFDCVRLGDEDENTIYVDDSGLVNGKIQSHGMFRVDGENPAYLAGHGLILATDAEGESVACTLTVEEVKSKVAFGEVVRLSGQLVFVELRKGEEANPMTVMTNRIWAIRD